MKTLIDEAIEQLKKEVDNYKARMKKAGKGGDGLVSYLQQKGVRNMSRSQVFLLLRMPERNPEILSHLKEYVEMLEQDKLKSIKDILNHKEVRI